MTARLLVREPDGAVAERPPEDLSELRDRPAWLDITTPHQKELALIAEELELHPLAVEDALHRHQRPKIEQYEAHSFLVAYAVERTARGAGARGGSPRPGVSSTPSSTSSLTATSRSPTT